MPLVGRDQKRLAAKRPKAIGSVGEVALNEIVGGNMPGVAETRLAGQRQHLGRAEETDERRPGRFRAFIDHLMLRPVLLFASSRKAKTSSSAARKQSSTRRRRRPSPCISAKPCIRTEAACGPARRRNRRRSAAAARRLSPPSSRASSASPTLR